MLVISSATVIGKATRQDADAYSGFAGTDLHERLRHAGVKRLFVGGLATDYCVLNTVRDALGLGKDSRVLLVSTEGDTDPQRYLDIVWDGEIASFGKL